MTAVDFDKFVERLADVSAEAIMPFFRTALAADDKAHGGAFDPVTEADRGAELAMRRLIEATFPDHGVYGEEFGHLRENAEYVWVLDPIDGTKSFICGLPLWGTLDRPHASRAPLLRPDEPAVYPRAVLRRRRGRLLARTGARVGGRARRS